MPLSDPPPRPAEQPSPDQTEQRTRWTNFRQAVTARTQLLVTTAYLAATSVVGVEVVAALLGVSALLPVTIPALLVSLTLFAVVRTSLRRVRVRRQRHVGRVSDSPEWK